MDIIICILTIMGFALILIWGGIALRSVFLFASSQDLERIKIPAFLTRSKTAYVKDAFLDVGHKKYIAEVVCPKLGDRSLSVAETTYELWLLCEKRITEFEDEISKTMCK